MAPMQTVFFLFALLGFKVRAEPCTHTQLQGCLDLVANAMDAMQDVDPAKLCPPLTKIVSCLENLKSSCDVTPDQLKGFEQIESVKSICSGGCSVTELAKCSKMPEKDEDMCLTLKENQNCLEKMLPDCEGELKTSVESALNSFKEGGAACSDSSEGCSLNDIGKCMSVMEDLDEGDHTKMCHVMKEVKTCLTPLKPKCKGDLLVKIDETLENMGSIDDECCDSIVKIQTECQPDIKDMAETFSAKTEECMKLEKGFVCIHKYSPKCKDGPMKTGLDQAVKGMNGRLDECQKNGYNITISLKQNTDNPGGSGVALYPAMALILFAFVMGRLNLF